MPKTRFDPRRIVQFWAVEAQARLKRGPREAQPGPGRPSPLWLLILFFLTKYRRQVDKNPQNCNDSFSGSSLTKSGR